MDERFYGFFKNQCVFACNDVHEAFSRAEDFANQLDEAITLVEDVGLEELEIATVEPTE